MNRLSGRVERLEAEAMPAERIGPVVRFIYNPETDGTRADVIARHEAEHGPLPDNALQIWRTIVRPAVIHAPA